MTLKKVFGIISYFPDCDTDYHTEARNTRIPRFYSLLKTLDKLWSDVDIMIIAQNWKDDVVLPDIHNRIIRYDYHKLGILNARRTLREKFLESDYDYLIMLDDDGIISAEDPTLYMSEIDKHPSGIGVIRHNKCPLMLLAISKEIYEQIDMPDVDPEKGEAFEDDIFVASCFARFPSKAFDFPKDCVKEISFRYDGPDKVPSTWSREQKLDWSYLRSNTLNILSEIKGNKVEHMDLVIPYVNCADTEWQKVYQASNNATVNNSVRFRSWGTLKYLFRSVDKYLPFIDRIVLIVAQPSQVPVWLNQKTVKVVYHKDFIPKEFLPTFNSCTIESFLYNIPDLSDKFIYVNDDMFAISPCTVEDFFTGDKPNIKFVKDETYSRDATFRCQCRSGLDMICQALGQPSYKEGRIMRPYHITASMTKESLLQVKKLCGDKIPSTITKLRDVKNVNQYIYSYYQYFTGNYESKVITYKYFTMSDKTFNAIRQTILSNDYQWVCLNDSKYIQNYGITRGMLIETFKKKFPNRCRYEL